MIRPGKALVPALAVAVGVAGTVYVARSRKKEIQGFVVAQVLERPAARLSFADFAQGLERGGLALARRAARAADTDANRAVLTHIIGIERWGQNRLRVALGQRPPLHDEHHPYKPGAGTTLRELQDLLSQTRAQTVDLARQLHDTPPVEGTTVEHNGLGPLTPGAWLRYLTGHADLESRRLRGARAAQTPH